MTRHPLIKGWRKHLKARRVGKNFVKREMKLTYIGDLYYRLQQISDRLIMMSYASVATSAVTFFKRLNTPSPQTFQSPNALAPNDFFRRIA
jgi:hypothetical protein